MWRGGKSACGVTSPPGCRVFGDLITARVGLTATLGRGFLELSLSLLGLKPAPSPILYLLCDGCGADERYSACRDGRCVGFGCGSDCCGWFGVLSLLSGGGFFSSWVVDRCQRKVKLEVHYSGVR